MKNMKIMLAMSLLFTVNSAFAEYNETYCGRLVSGNGFKTEELETPSAVLFVDVTFAVDSYSNKKGQAYALVAVTGLDGAQEAKVAKILKSKKVADVCVNGTWSGRLQPSPITAIPVHSSYVESITYAK